ncbi:MAG: hypothetical protein Q4C71_04205 [Microbacteriaceae bacterium]|nr:hypothetical protein [Microbacteriaceae bacterium]
MSEQSSNKAGLSRRELRKRQQQEQLHQAATAVEQTHTGAIELGGEVVELNEAQTSVVIELKKKAADFKAVDENGQPLERRALRRAQKAEYDRLLAEWEKANGPLNEYGKEAADAEPIVDAPKPAEDPVLDTGALPKTEPISITELQATGLAPETAEEAEWADKSDKSEEADKPELAAEREVADAEPASEKDAVDATPAPVSAKGGAGFSFDSATLAAAAESTDGAADAEVEAGEETAAETEKAGKKNKRKRGLFGRKKEDEQVEAEAETEAETKTDVEIDPEIDLGAAAEPDAEVIIDEELRATEEDVVAEITAPDETENEPADGKTEAEAAAPIEYSFPEIAPQEDRSIFDDENKKVKGKDKKSKGQTSFDELLNTEGGKTAGASALILPSLPDAITSTGALDKTGDIFVSGVIGLPKSLSETGSHHSLHGNDVIDDSQVYGEITADEANDHTRPMPALRSVSAQHGEEGELLTGGKKKFSNKAPIAFAISGGVLILASVGVIIYGASNGLFG